MHCVITAGGRVDAKFAAEIGTEVKALANIGGRSLLERAVVAAREAGAQTVSVVGGREVRDAAANFADRVIAEAPTGRENVHLALAAFPGRPLLYLTSDLPFVTGTQLREFLSRLSPGSLGMPLAAADAYERRFAGAPEHATVIGGERIANGSAFFIPAGCAERIDTLAQRVFEARKNLLRMAVMLGPSLLLKFATKRLRIADVERKAADLLGFPVVAVRDCAPELCFDIDTLEDYRYAKTRA